MFDSLDQWDQILTTKQPHLKWTSWPFLLTIRISRVLSEMVCEIYNNDHLIRLTFICILWYISTECGKSSQKFYQL